MPAVAVGHQGGAEAPDSAMAPVPCRNRCPKAGPSGQHHPNPTSLANKVPADPSSHTDKEKGCKQPPMLPEDLQTSGCTSRRSPRAHGGPRSPCCHTPALQIPAAPSAAPCVSQCGSCSKPEPSNRLMLGSQDTMCAHPQPEPLPDPASPGLSPTGSSLLTVAGEKGARRRHQQPRLSPAGSFSTCQLLHSSLPCIPPTPKFSEATFLLYLSW